MLFQSQARTRAPTPTEQLLSNYAERVFLPLWSYPSPYSTPQQELCDLLAVAEDNIFIFSDKNINLSLPDSANASPEDFAVYWNRWFKKAVKKSAAQLWGAESHLKQKKEIYLNQKCDKAILLSCDMTKANYHLVLIANGANEAMKRMCNPSDIPTLVINSFLQGTKDHKLSTMNIFRIGELDKTRTFVHVFDTWSFKFVMQHFDTATDLIGYLTERRNLLRVKCKGAIIDDERAFVVHYYRHYDKSKKQYSFPTNPSECLWIQGGNDMNNPVLRKIEGLKKADQNSYFWDYIINLCIENHRNKITTPEYSAICRVLAIMARENRFTRRCLSNNILDIIKRTQEDARRVRAVHSETTHGVVYVFYVAQRGNLTIEQDTECRGEILQAYTVLVLEKYSSYRECIGLSFGAGGDIDTSNHLFAYVNREFLTSDLKKRAHRLQNRFRLLKKGQDNLRGKKIVVNY